jgi:hypothetical protein
MFDVFEEMSSALVVVIQTVLIWAKRKQTGTYRKTSKDIFFLNAIFMYRIGY